MTFEAAQFKRIYLSPYEEACGVFRGLEKDDYSVSVLFEDFQVAFNSDSTEAKIVEEALVEAIPGEKIAILRTDIPEKPIIVRIDQGGDSCHVSPPIATTKPKGRSKGGNH